MVSWIEYPRLGTSVLPGQWLCTLRTRRTRAGFCVEILTLDKTLGWMRSGGEIVDDEMVVAVADVPAAPAWLTHRAAVAKADTQRASKNCGCAGKGFEFCGCKP